MLFQYRCGVRYQWWQGDVLVVLDTPVDRSMKGLYPILATPFDSNDQVVVEDLQCEVDFVIDKGVHGIGIANASEIYKLSEAERDLVIQVVVDQNRGRVPVVVNTGAPSTVVTIQYSRRAEELGADAVMIVPPGASPEGTKQHFRSVAEAVSVPIFMQDVPTGPVPPTLAAEIAHDIPSACYIKSEAGPQSRIAEAVAAGNGELIVFGGASGSMLLEELRSGAVGTMPHAVAPDLFRSVLDLYDAGDYEAAETTFNAMTPLLRAQGNGPTPLYLIKEVLRMRGIFTTNNVRQPVAQPSDNDYRELRATVEKLVIVD